MTKVRLECIDLFRSQANASQLSDILDVKFRGTHDWVISTTKNRDRQIVSSVAPDLASSGYMWEGSRNTKRQMLLHDGDCGLWFSQAHGSGFISRSHQEQRAHRGQSPLISVSQLFISERSGPVQRGGASL